jgi:hypothetical protein
MVTFAKRGELNPLHRQMSDPSNKVDVSLDFDAQRLNMSEILQSDCSLLFSAET